MPDASLSVAVLVGSLRRGSYNAALARALPALAPEGMAFTPLGSIGDIPLYDADLQAQGFPAQVTAMAEAIRAADGVIVVTPEYNYSLPGGLKNALDWLSRLKDQPFAGRAMAIQSAAASTLGGARAQYHLRQVMVFLDGLVMTRPEVMVPTAHTKFSEAGELTDEGTRKVVQAQLAAFAAFVRRVGRPPRQG